jgi:diguanylate cyclase (GGDEF)-like protein
LGVKNLDNIGIFIKNDILKKNRRVMKAFLIIFLMIDASYYLLSLSDYHVSWYSDSNIYLKIAQICLAAEVFLFLLNKKGHKSFLPYLNYIFVLYTVVSRLAFLTGFRIEGFVVLPYVGFYLAIASIFYFSYEILVSSIITQFLLFFILLKSGMGRYEIFSTIIVSTLLLMMACHIAFSRMANYKRVTRSEHQLLEGKALLDEMLSRIDTMVVLVNTDRTIKYINEAFIKITGIKIEEKDYQHITDLFSDSELKPVIKGFNYVSVFKKPYLIEKYVVYKKGSYEMSLKISMDYISLNDNSYIILAANDHTREVQLSKVKDTVIRLNNMLSQYQSLDDYFGDILRRLVGVIPYVQLGSVLLKGEDGYMTMKANVGYDKKRSEEFKLSMEESFFYRKCGSDYGKPVIINDLNNYSMEGVADIPDNIYGIRVASSLSCPIIIDGKFTGLLNLDSSDNNVFNHEDLEIMEFLTEQISLVLTSHKLLDQTIYLSKFDQLTGLYNRWYLNEFESVTIPHCVRYNESFCFVMMDINNLKMVNDFYGHSMGDAYIIEFAKLLRMNSRETDILIRIGGDEFVGVFFDIDRALLNNKIEDINEKLMENMKVLGVECSCNAAFGMAAFPEESQIMDELMRLSDLRMYTKKVEMKK